MLATIRSIHQKTPIYFRWLFFPFKILYRLIVKLRIDIWMLTGNDSLKREIRIIYAGSEKHKNYLASLVFHGVYTEINMGKWLWHIFKITKRDKNACSLMVLEINKTFRRLFGDTKSFFIPWWLNGEVDISIDTSLIIGADSSLKSDIRRIKKHNLQFELAKNEYQFDNFYNNMYLPYITMAHGNKAHQMNYSSMKKQLKKCDLLLIKKENEHVGGILINYENNVPRLWSIGIKDGNADFLKAGVIGALYYFSVEYLKQKGYKKVHFGISRAFLKDGVLQYKRKWGMKIVASTKKGFLIKPLSASIVTKDFFINNPFICVDQDGLTGAIFMQNDQLRSKKNYKKLHKESKLEGVSRFVLYIFSDNRKDIEDIAPAELSERMTICSGERFFLNCHGG